MKIIGNDNVTISTKVKRKNKYNCSECCKPIEVGEKYISALYSDGFIKRGVGAFHVKCFEKMKGEENG